MQNPNIHRLLAAARSVHQVDESSWTCYCPIHEASPGTHANSLSLHTADDGKILVKCHNGCDPKEIVYAFGLTWTDMFPERNQPASSQITAVYDYLDESGVLRFQVCRLEPGKDGRPKDFRQRQPDGNGGWTWKTKGLVKFPYRLPELLAAKGKPVLIVEGEKQVDYLRSLGLTATCNPGGAGKWLKSFARWFADRDVIVIPDCDPPNERTGKIVGAEHARDVADSLIGVAKSIHVVELPDCQPKWGMDDWLQKGGHTLEEFSEIMATAPEWGPESSIVTQVPIMGMAETTMPDQGDPIDYDRNILREIGIVYCAETESMDIEVFSSVFRKFSIIRDPGKLTYSRLLQVAGKPALNLVSQNSMDEGKKYTLHQIKNSLAIVAGASKRGSEKLGQGIWRLNDKTILVNGSHIGIYHDGQLTKDLSAVFEDTVFNLGDDGDWFDFDEVAYWISRPERSWVAESMHELCDILGQWCFKIPDRHECPSVCSEVLASLIVASWIQSFWMFRPMVFLLGESNCGKSTLMQLLTGEESNPLDKGLMGALAIHSANQSAAGIRQAAEHSSRPVFVDEFEKGKHRSEILELLRGASRGSQSLRGTAGQKAVTTKVAFMAWAASTESGLVKQVDQNRWIQIQMVPPTPDKMGKLRLPDLETLASLRSRLVAASVVIGNDARAMVDSLMARRPKDIDHRICQIFSVPAAVFACMTGIPEASASGTLNRFLKIFDMNSLERDQDVTLDTVLTSKVRIGTQERTVLSLLESLDGNRDPLSTQYEETLAANGIRILWESKFDSSNKVFFHSQSVSRHLIKDTQLAGVKLDELLLRLPHAERAQRKISGKNMRGITVPLSSIIQHDNELDLFAEV